MTKIATLTAALMICAPMAMAQGIGLYVGADCDLAAAQSVTNTCTGNSGTAIAAFLTCVVPNGGMPSFVGVNSLIDVQTNLATIPDWWRVDACRGVGFVMAADNTIGGSAYCTGTLWDAVNPAGSNISGLVVGGSRERFQVGSVLYLEDIYDLPGDGVTELAVARWTVLKDKTLGASPCGGCLQGACIVLNQVELQGRGAYPSYMRLTQPIGTHNYITYNAGAPICAASTPTQNRTWGSVKALYR